MKKWEQKFCSDLQKWFVYNINLFKRDMCIEAKISLGNKPFNFKSGFKPHQIPTLIKISKGVVVHKPSDMAMVTQLFDIEVFYKTKTWIAFKWIRPGNKTFYLLDPMTIQGMIEDGKKSITEQEASNYADFIGEIGKIMPVYK